MREARGITQEDFNNGEGPINERTIRRIENAELTNLELMTLLRIAERLELHPSQLLDVDVPWDVKPLPETKPKRKRKRRP